MAVNSAGARLDPLELARHGPVIPVIVIERVADAVPMALQAAQELAASDEAWREVSLSVSDDRP